MGLEKRAPGATAATLGRRIDASIAEDALDGAAREVMAEVVESASNTRVAPRRIVPSHAQDERRQVRLRYGAPRAAPTAPIVLASHELSVPAQQRITRHDSGDTRQHGLAQGCALDCHASPLLVGEAQASTCQLLAQDAIFLAQHKRSRSRSLPTDTIARRAALPARRVSGFSLSTTESLEGELRSELRLPKHQLSR